MRTTEPSRILLVAGNNDLLDGVREQLELARYTVVITTDPAADIVSAGPEISAAIVVLDEHWQANLAGLLESLAARNLSIPVVAYSENHDAQALSAALEQGADDFLCGVVSPNLLRTRIDGFADSRKVSRLEVQLQEEKEGLRFERDLQIARNIQADFLPQVLPTVDGWELSTYFQPARLVAGDFYDVFTLVNNRRVGIVVADVCGKGVGAALFMALFRSLIRAFAQQHYAISWMDALTGDDPLESGADPGARRGLPTVGSNALRNAVVQTNNYIGSVHANAHMFATLFFGVLDPVTGTLQYVNGGHNPPLIVGAGSVKARLTRTGPPLGLFPDMPFAIETTQIDPGDYLIVYTDGVTEAFSSDESQYGEERLTALATGSWADASMLLKAIEEDLRSHTAGAEQSDDITMLALRRQEEQR